MSFWEGAEGFNSDFRSFVNSQQNRTRLKNKVSIIVDRTRKTAGNGCLPRGSFFTAVLANSIDIAFTVMRNHSQSVQSRSGSGSLFRAHAEEL